MANSELVRQKKIDAETAARFARVIGIDPVHDVVVPPTYLTSFRDAELEVARREGFSLEQLIHGDQSYEFRVDAPCLRVGDTIEYSSRLLQRSEKKSAQGRLQILVVETRFSRKQASRDELVAEARTTLLVRE